MTDDKYENLKKNLIGPVPVVTEQARKPKNLSGFRFISLKLLRFRLGSCRVGVWNFFNWALDKWVGHPEKL
jgi:hypothetical protein